MKKRKAYERFVIICGIISLVDIVVRVVRYLYPKIKKNTEKFVGDDVEELVEQLFDMSGVKLDKGEESEDECKKQSKESIITEIANMKEETYLEDLLDDMMDEEEESVEDTELADSLRQQLENSEGKRKRKALFRGRKRR